MSTIDKVPPAMSGNTRGATNVADPPIKALKRGPLRALLGQVAALHAFDVVLLVYNAGILALIAAFWRSIPGGSSLALGHLAVFAIPFVLLKTASLSPRPVWQFVRDWYPVPLICLFFKETTVLVPAVNPVDMDPVLIVMDRALFGNDPTVLLEAMSTPWLSEIFQWVYATFYFLPVGLGLVLYFGRSRAGFLEGFLAILLAFFTSYIGYFLVPAVGPARTLVGLQTFELEGVWAFTWIREVLFYLEGTMRDCYPSGHVEVTLVTIWYAYRFRSKVFRVILPLGTALIFSTVYLRYHYVVDLLAAVPFAVAVVLVSPILHRAWEKLHKT